MSWLICCCFVLTVIYYLRQVMISHYYYHVIVMSAHNHRFQEIYNITMVNAMHYKCMLHNMITKYIVHREAQILCPSNV